MLAEEANDWFEGLPVDGSPYMSITAPARRGALSKVPAVCHVDGSSRLQTVKRQDNPLYHRLISAFFKLTSVPMVLNTSFNVMGEPIVDSPGGGWMGERASAAAVLVVKERCTLCVCRWGEGGVFWLFSWTCTVIERCRVWTGKRMTSWSPF